MERLTYVNGNGYIYFVIDGYKVRIDDVDVLKVAERLKYYEDLAEQERLIILPCKIGTKVYVVEDIGNWYDIPCGHEWECEFCSTDCPSYRQEYIVKKVVSPRIVHSYLDAQIIEEKLGKSAFLSKEEAESSLKTNG